MPYEVIFLIPIIVGLVWVVYQFVQHRKEWAEWRAHCPFRLVKRDTLTYVVPSIRGKP